MNKMSNAGLFAAVLAVAFVGVLALGTPPPTLALVILVVVCPLMMLIMMYGMHGREPVGRRHGHAHDQYAHDQHAHDQHHRFSSSQGSE
jgi:hypothetical protein